MQQVFNHLWCITDQYIRIGGEYNLVPWCGNEVSLCGLLTAAAFRAGFISLDEFSKEKKAEESAGHMGRVDWWVSDDKYEILAEAKALWLGPGASWKTVSEKMDAARDQLNLFPREDKESGGRLQIVFVRLYYGPRNDAGRAWDDWLGDDAEPADPKGISYMSYYLLHQQSEIFGDQGFPSDCSGHVYPGLIVCCREV